MGLSCGGKFVKLLLLVFNIIFWLSSITLFGLGIYFLVENERASLFRLFTTPKFSYALLEILAWAFVVIGTGTFFVSLCGCCGTLRNNRFVLIIYGLLLLVIFALELTVGILAIIFQERLTTEIKTELVPRLQKEYGLQSSFTAAIDLAQTKFECCGIESPKDYKNSIWSEQQLNGANSVVSRTCCLLQNSHEPQAHVNPRPINETLCQSNKFYENQMYRHQAGCRTKLEAFVHSQSIIFVVLGCSLGSITFIGFVLSICFCRSVQLASGHKDEDNRRH